MSPRSNTSVACVLLALVTPPLVAADASASAKYGGCVVEGKGAPCRHRFVGGDLLFARFTNRTDAKTAYTVGVFPGRKRRDAVTVKLRSARYVDISRGLAPGRYTVRWYVGGAQVARYRITYVAEGD